MEQKETFSDITVKVSKEDELKQFVELFTLLIEIDQDIKKKEKQNDRHN